jgi:hypothetical protein
MPSPIRGACLCGAIQFELDPPSRFLAHCHCTMCRRAHGAVMVTWIGVLRPQFRLTAGEPALTRYQSSPGATRSFCNLCGTSLFFEAERWAGEIHIAAACLIDPPDPDHVLPNLGGPPGTEKL